VFASKKFASKNVASKNVASKEFTSKNVAFQRSLPNNSFENKPIPKTRGYNSDAALAAINTNKARRLAPEEAELLALLDVSSWISKLNGASSTVVCRERFETCLPPSTLDG